MWSWFDKVPYIYFLIYNAFLLVKERKIIQILYLSIKSIGNSFVLLFLRLLWLIVFIINALVLWNRILIIVITFALIALLFLASALKTILIQKVVVIHLTFAIHRIIYFFEYFALFIFVLVAADLWIIDWVSFLDVDSHF